MPDAALYIVFFVAILATGMPLLAVSLYGSALALRATWKLFFPRREDRAVVVGQIVGQPTKPARPCPAVGDKFCEMRGCAILGSCQHPDLKPPLRLTHS